jgi:hypothetical protein
MNNAPRRPKAQISLQRVRSILQADSTVADILEDVVDCSTEIVDLVIEAIVDRRQRLESLALSVLPSIISNQFSTMEKKVLDEKALWVCRALLDLDI